MIQDKASYKAVWVIQRFFTLDDYMRGNRPYSISTFEDNILLNEGITALQNLLTGAAETAFGNADAWLGVGTSSGSVSAAQTGLQGAGQAYRPMEATYPQIASQTTTWRSIFAGDQGNFQWEEFTVANASGTAGGVDNLNRRVSDQGIKASGTTWTLDLEITWS